MQRRSPSVRSDRCVGALDRRFAQPARHAVLPGAGRRIVGQHHLDLDAGLAVQPRNVATQTEGCIICALGHVREKITIRNGRVLESNTGYEVTRMSDVSNIEIKVVSANDVPRVVDITQVADRLSERS
jgi:hypothetical protein